MDKEDTDFARIWARRYIREHRPHGLDASDVENMILRRLHYNKDKSERGRRDIQTVRPRRLRSAVQGGVEQGFLKKVGGNAVLDANA